MPTPCVVSGNLQTLTGNLIAQGKVIFQLTNIGTGNPIGVSGTSIIPALSYTVLSAPDGSFSIGIWGNDVLTPANTLYAVTFRDQQGNEVGPILYSIVGASANMNTLVAAGTVTPPVIVSGAVLLNPTALQTITGFPLAAPAFRSPNANPSATGILRLANTDIIAWRNSANSGDVQFQILGAQGGNFPPDTLYYRGRNDGNALIEADAFASNDAITSIPASGFIRMGSTRSLSWRNNAGTGDILFSKTGAASGNIPADTFITGGGSGIAATFFSQGTTTDAATGVIRLANIANINWRNTANNADVGLTVSGAAFGNSPADVLFAIGGPAAFMGNFFSDPSTTTAATGTFRMPQGSAVSWRNAANTGDVSLFTNSFDALAFGSFVMPQIVAAVNLTAQTATIGTTTLYAVPTGRQGMYRISVSLITTTAGAAGTVLATFTANDGTVTTNFATPTISLAALNDLIGTTQVTSMAFYSTQNVNISYATTVTGGAGSQYTLRIRLEYLGQ